MLKERRRRRSQSRRLQTFNRFNHEIAESLNLDRKAAIELIGVILGNVVCRIGPREANDLVSQLPRKWQNVFLDLPAGPDRQIKARTLIEEIGGAVHTGATEGRELARRFWKLLGKTVSAPELDQVVGQLPKDIQKILLNESELADFKKRHDPHALDLPFP